MGTARDSGLVPISKRRTHSPEFKRRVAIEAISGRHGKSVRKLRFMPMVRAHELARKLQARFGTTVSVV